MTQVQKDAIANAQAKYFAAQEKVEVEGNNMAQAQSVLEAAQHDLTYDAPARAAKIVQDSKDGLARATAARDAQFQITSAAYVSLDSAQLELENAIRTSRQTGAIEKVA